MPDDRVDLLLRLADDELILGWRNSEWTGIAPFLEEDVAFSSIAQNEIGHARALYELAARELGTDADAVAFDRRPPSTGGAARRAAAGSSGRARSRDTGSTRRPTRSGSTTLKRSDDAELAGIAAKIDREEVYHRIHAEMWVDRLLGSTDGRARLDEALEELWPYALGVLGDELRPELVRRVRAKLDRSSCPTSSRSSAARTTRASRRSTRR